MTIDGAYRLMVQAAFGAIQRYRNPVITCDNQTITIPPGSEIRDYASYSVAGAIDNELIERLANPPMLIPNPDQGRAGPAPIPDPDHAPPGEESVIISDLDNFNRRAVQHYLIASGPVDIVWLGALAAYRITGPDIIARLERAMGLSPRRTAEIQGQTATEVPGRPGHYRMNIPEAMVLRPGGLTYFVDGEIQPPPMGPRIDFEAVDKKAKLALWGCLDDRQREDLFVSQHFLVRGSKSAYIYEIRKGRQGNVVRDDLENYCLTHGDLPVWDLMLAQKLMIEDDEPKFLKMANRLDEPFYHMNEAPDIINTALIEIGGGVVNTNVES